MIRTRLKENAALVERALAERVKTVSALNPLQEDAALDELYRAQEYSLLAGGKRIRPTLVLECCRALGGTDAAALPFAVAVEMVHTYSLIHDDLPGMDNDDMRRGKPTNHKVFGEATAILSGDSLLTDAFSVIAAHDAVDANTRLLAVQVLAEAAGSGGMVGGQIMDMAGERSPLDLPTLECLHARKTGALIRAAAKLGALAAGVMPQDAAWQAMDTYAAGIGLAFQVVDDILDVTADPTLLGKSLGKDATAGKTTYLTYYTLDEAAAYARELTEQACRTVEPYDREGVLCAAARYLAERVY